MYYEELNKLVEPVIIATLLDNSSIKIIGKKLEFELFYNLYNGDLYH